MLLSFNLWGSRPGCCLVSWPLCDVERVLIVLLGLPGMGWSLNLISLMLRACSQLPSDCLQAKGTWTILKFHRNFYKSLNEENWYLFEVSKFTIVWLFLLMTFLFFCIGVEAMHSAPDLPWLRYYQTFFSPSANVQRVSQTSFLLTLSDLLVFRATKRETKAQVLNVA